MIPTAEELFLEHINEVPLWQIDIPSIMIKFTKLHVEVALKKAAEQADKAFIGNRSEYKKRIINSYPLTNIK